MPIPELSDDFRGLGALDPRSSHIESGIFRYLIRVLSRRVDETLIGIFFDRDFNCLDIQIMAYGNPKYVAVSIRRLLRVAIQCGATAYVLAHNHPSGNMEPSHLDRQSTKNAKMIGEIIGIELIDHFIVAGKNIYSIVKSAKMQQI